MANLVFDRNDLRVKVVHGKTRRSLMLDGEDVCHIQAIASRTIDADSVTAILIEKFAHDCMCEEESCGCLAINVANVRRRSRNGRRWSATLKYRRKF